MAATHSGILSTLSLVMLTIVNQGKEKREERNWWLSYQQLLAAVFISLPLSARIAPRVRSIETDQLHTVELPSFIILSLGITTTLKLFDKCS